MHYHLLALLTLASIACSSPPTSHGMLTVSASTLEWAAVAGGERQVQSLVVGNASDGALVVTPLLSPGDARFSLVSSAPLRLAARSSATLEVTFDPDQATPALAWLQLAASDGASTAIRLRAEVEPRADCTLWALLTREYGQPLSPVPLEVHANNSGRLLDGPWRWSLVDMPDLQGPRLFADDQPYGLAVGLGASPSDDEVVGGSVAHLNVVTHSAPHTVRVRDDAGRGCEATFFADVRIPGQYPAVSCS
ncbi:MAG: hypothetical protein HYS27_05005 [Deltaproteobacteria bacterium]|nr:hypothetical protein [Deltaproteobacteria bacterium]